jgi:hypothetical protein
MIETLGQGNDWLAWIEQFKHDDGSPSAGATDHQTHSHASHRAAWDHTDRLLQFPARNQTSESHWDRSTVQAGPVWSDRARWLQEHDVHTQFLDGGIGGCWSAQHGDDEPVFGETEEVAIARLMRESGLS